MAKVEEWKEKRNVAKVGESGDFMVISPKDGGMKVGDDGDRVGKQIGTGDWKGGEMPGVGRRSREK